MESKKVTELRHLKVFNEWIAVTKANGRQAYISPDVERGTRSDFTIGYCLSEITAKGLSKTHRVRDKEGVPWREGRKWALAEVMRLAGGEWEQSPFNRGYFLPKGTIDKLMLGSV